MKRLRKPLSRLLVLLALGLAILPLLGCTPEDALGLLTTVVENLPEGTDAPEPTAPPEETATPAQTPEPASPTPGLAHTRRRLRRGLYRPLRHRGLPARLWRIAAELPHQG